MCGILGVVAKNSVNQVLYDGLLVLIAGMTPLPHQKTWRHALSSPPLVTLAKHIRPWLPDALSERIHFE